MSVTLTKLGAGSIISYTASSSLRSKLIKLSTECIEIYKPICPITIILPTLDEEKMLVETLDSIMNQCVIQEFPEYFEIIIADSESIDGTIKIAQKYNYVISNSIVSVPKGKLTARHIATQFASGDIIVSIDADTYYPPNWLNKTLCHFYDSNVIGVSGSSFTNSTDHRMYSMLFTIYNSFLLKFGKKMVGRNSAYLKQAYYQVGGFDLNINQQDLFSMIKEEERGFYNKLSNLGKIVIDPGAAVITSDRFTSRIFKCDENDLYCKEITDGTRF